VEADGRLSHEAEDTSLSPAVRSRLQLSSDPVKPPAIRSNLHRSGQISTDPVTSPPIRSNLHRSHLHRSTDPVTATGERSRTEKEKRKKEKRKREKSRTEEKLIKK
jgi:hypothetical protein